MFLEVKLPMKKYIDKIDWWLKNHPKLKQYLWFIGLWFLGLITVSVLTYPIKLLIRYLG